MIKLYADFHADVPPEDPNHGSLGNAQRALEKDTGIRAMLPHVDEPRPVHSLESLEGLCAALAKPSMNSSEKI
jgi:hypothetical protein